jgi:hypothetical protein
MRIYWPIVRMICTATFIGAVGGCDRKPSQPTKTMTTEELIRQSANLPIGQSVIPITTSLAKQSVFVATDDTATSQPTTTALQHLRFKTAADKLGRMWVYAYTNQAEFSRAFPQGGPFYELSFADFFGVVERDAQFAGIFLNSGSDASYPIPREVFGKAKEAMGQK